MPPPDSVLYPPLLPRRTPALLFFGDLNPHGIAYYVGQAGKQPAAADQRDGQRFLHRWRTPAKVRAGLSPPEPGEQHSYLISVQYLFLSLSNVLANNDARGIHSFEDPSYAWSSRTGACSPRTRGRSRAHLTITYGLRWEYNAAPSSPNGTLPFTVTR